MANTGYIGVGPADRDPTVSDDSVTTAKIQNNAVTGAKIAMTSDAAGDILTYTGTDYARLGIGAATQVLKVNAGATAVEWAADTVNAGDVVGPGSSTNNALVRFDLTTGKIIQNSTATLTDAGTLSATAFSGPLTGAVTGDVTGNVSGTAATVTGATQSAITALGTIASLVATTADISGGTFDGIVGGTTPAAITGTQVDITAQGDLRLQDTTGGEYVGFQAAATTTTYTVTMPATAAASNGQALTTTTAGIGSWSTVGDASLASAQEWTAQQNFNNTALVFDATQDWALAANQVATLTLTANTIFDAPTQMVDGAFYSLIIIQDGTGSRTASWNTVFKWAAATAPTLTTTASAKDIFVWRSDGTNMYEVGRQLNVS